ncbi:MAG: type II toxin-antitoxin system HicA family toxin [Gemmataceae bacterium]
MKAISGKAMCKVLERNGWELKRTKSSHHIYGKPGVDVIVTVPVHGNRDLRTGTQKKIMKDAGLTENDLT